MNNRLLQFINAENISQSQFADTIGVARASVSHILSGRNKPGFDFIEGMSRHYPALNLEWLITGKGKMYKGQADSTASSSFSAPQQESAANYDEDDLFAHLEDTPSTSPSPTASVPSTAPSPTASVPSSEPAPSHRQSSAAIPCSGSERQIARIIVFFSDNTFQELK